MSEFKLKGDELDRGRYARSLYNIIGEYYLKYNNILNKPINGTDNKSFVIGISAQWGFGKTTFVEMLRNVLTGTGVEDSAGKHAFEQHFDRNTVLSKTQVNIYNAWENDYFNNALEPLFYNLAEKIFPQGIREAETKLAINTVLNGLKNALFKAAPLATESPSLSDGANVVQELGDTYTQANKTTNEETAKYAVFKNYEDLRTQIENLKNLLEKEIQKITQNDNEKKRKIVIIIDELDRCKPDFAVQTLELVKHLFNISGIVFIFSLDITQLQHCVKVVYGRDFDAVGYLERFFDYTTLLPAGDRFSLFTSFAKKFNVISGIEDPQAKAYFNIAEQFSLSAREMQAILAPFSYLLRYELKDYGTIAKQVYFYLYALKYKEPVNMLKVNANRSEHFSVTEFDQTSTDNTDSDESVRLSLLRKYPIKLAVQNAVINNESISIFDAIFAQNPVIKKGAYIRLNSSGVPSKESLLKFEIIRLIDLGPEESLSFVLYKKDLEMLESIKDFRILQYMYRKIELYDTPFN